MRRRAALHRALCGSVIGVLLLLSGCSSLPFFSTKSDADAAAREREPEIALYAFDVVAPRGLRAMLLTYLDVARFQTAPKSDAIAGAELDRLAAAAPAQARALLETEGYFDAHVTIARSPRSSNPDDLPQLTMTVVPGQQVRVRSVDITSTGPLAERTPTREEPYADRLVELRETWALKPGAPFRQPDWDNAKTAALGGLRAKGYPKATWQSTHAAIDATAGTAALQATIDSGPLFHLGAIRVEGVNRYDVDAVKRLATFFYGDTYSERLLLDYQDRLAKIGLFEGASVELDANGSPDAAPVLVKVKELTRYQATFGVGYSANTGPRVSADYFDRKIFGQPWVAHTTLTYGADLKSLAGQLTSYPHDNLWRDLVSANIEQLKAADETRDSWATRLGRTQETMQFDRTYYLQAAHAKVSSAPLVDSANAVSGNYNWIRRDLDSLLSPTLGSTLSLQGGGGYGRGTETRTDLVGEISSRGPFARAYVDAHWYRPFGGWYANARAEAGQVFVHDRIGVPDTILFRAGGDNSVRGYGYRTLGPTVNGAIVAGRVLATGSIEVEHPLTDRVPALLGALFIDAGNAADGWSQIRPVFGYGAGLHFRSPVGPLRLDVAYGEAVHQFRLHLTVGVSY